MFDDLLAANRRYAAGFTLQGIPGAAAKRFALVTCMDSRIEPLVMLGLSPGDAKILRNAGGRVTADVLRSLVLATTFLGVENVAVMHHTDCALAGRDDAEVRAGLSPEQREASAGLDFLAMPDPDAALAADVQAVRSYEALPTGVRVEGWRYDVGSGAVLRVIPSQAVAAGDGRG
ncbi:MAG TPA: carbonic anhydrase [Acidimicrobiales bacterium]|jgi:carbonic anhydrase|nr:carbonic anhydrase [Acidimicrobiales bacterium]